MKRSPKFKLGDIVTNGLYNFIVRDPSAGAVAHDKGPWIPLVKVHRLKKDGTEHLGTKTWDIEEPELTLVK